MYFQSRLAVAAYNGGSYILTDTDAMQASQIEIPAGKEFTLDPMVKQWVIQLYSDLGQR